VISVGVVLATYNRLSFLQQALGSVRENAGLPCEFVVVDGGSTDGTKDWLRDQGDVLLIEQELPLTGAVRAFNLGFGAAVDRGYPYVFHYNDDAQLVTPNGISDAMTMMAANPLVGCVAFAFDLWGPWGFDSANGKVYSNFGLIRREAGMAVARAQGDPEGKCWWNPIYRTYAADTELGMWMHRLGWEVLAAKELRVHDCCAQDELRQLNEANNPQRADSQLFWRRWSYGRSPAAAQEVVS